MELFGNPSDALAWTACFAGAGILLDTIERLADRAELSDGGMFAWTWLRGSAVVRRRSLLARRAMAIVFDVPGVFGLLWLRLCGAFVVLTWPGVSAISTIGLAAIFATGSLLNVRDAPTGGATATRVLTMISGVLLLTRLAPASGVVAAAALWFIALQAALSYVTAGVGKLRHRGWRSGSRLAELFAMASVGAPQDLARFLRAHPTVSGTLARAIVAAECTLPIVILGVPHAAPYVLAAGVGFHLVNAAVLGLNTYFWAWLTMYPALGYVAP